MKLNRTKNATKNIIFGTILKLYQIIIPFIMRTAMIYWLGVEYLGLNSLFTSVLQVLNLVELGIGSAMVYSMYKPIAKDDEVEICALMKLYKIYYRIIGLVILVLGMILCPFIPHLIKSDVPADMNVYVLYILNLLATVFSYWLFSYKNCLLSAHQRTDVTSKITIIINTIMYVAQFLLLFIFRNYYFYVIALLLGQITINIATAFVVDKMYPNYQAKGNLPKEEIKEINKRVKDLFTAKIGGVIVNSVDTIVISAFLGLSTLAVYENYFYILKALIAIVAVIFSSCTAGIGNSIIMESKEKNFRDFNKFTFIIFWLAGLFSCCLIGLYQNFMILWVGKDLLLDFPCVICLVIYFFVYEINAVLLLYKDAAGIWHKDRFRPLVTALTNLILNLILVNVIGLYGVLLSTVLSSIIIGLPWLIQNLFTEIFKENPKKYLIKILKYTILTIITCVITYWACNLVNGNTFYTLIIKAIICVSIPNVFYTITCYRSSEMQEAISLIKKIMKR